MGAKLCWVTAGALIRRALLEGISELGLAKLLAENSDDSDREVKRWRYVVRRARAGGEPRKENVIRIVEALLRPGEVLADPDPKQAHPFEGHLEELAAAVGKLEDGQAEILAAIENARSQLLDALQPPPARSRPSRS